MTVQISAQHKAVGIPYRLDVENLFPSAQKVTFKGTPMLVLPHGFTETKILNNLGIEVDAPILHQYDWAGGSPFNVQKQTAAMLTTNQRAYVLNGMGTGKTKTALWAFDFLRQAGIAKRALITAPLSTLNFVWAREAFDTVPHLSVGILHHPSKERRLRVLAEEHDIYVINPDGLKLLHDELINRGDIDTFIIDELATFRNGKSKRNKTARHIANGKRWVWGMTGSPTPTEPTDAWGQCLIVTPNTVPKYFRRFQDMVMTKSGPFRFTPKKESTQIVFEVMQPAVRFTLDDVVELPQVVERTIDVDMGPQQQKAYKTIKAFSIAQIAEKQITAVNAGAALNKLMQVALGYVYTREKEVVPLDNDVRLGTLIDLVNSTDRKVLVFVSFTHALDGVRQALTAEGIDCAVVDGRTPQSQRTKIFTEFQDDDFGIKVIVAHPKTMAHGLTLTAADTVIWFGPITSLEDFEQANARVRRIGQKHKQQIIMLQGTPTEKKIYARLRSKQAIQDNILALFAEDTTPTT
jgi:SNF2 family DNA or RNA helicase